MEYFVKRLGLGDTFKAQFIYLYRSDLYSDLRKSALYFRPTALLNHAMFNNKYNNIITCEVCH